MLGMEGLLMMVMKKMRNKIFMNIMNFFLKNRKRRHIAYVEKRVVELRKQIADQAVQFGYIDQMARTQFLKYNEYLKKLIK